MMERPRVTLHELQTVYSLEDLYNLIELGAVRAHNDRAAQKRHEQDVTQRG
jgi:hypothetical protein